MRKHIDTDEADELLELLRRGGLLVEDPEAQPAISWSDPKDDYLIALAKKSRSVLVSDDGDLLELSEQIPVYSPREFLDLLQDSD